MEEERELLLALELAVEQVLDTTISKTIISRKVLNFLPELFKERMDYRHSIRKTIH
jgi:hypothetical protein